MKLSNKLFWIVILIGFTGLSAHNYLGPEHEKHLDHPVKGEHNPHPGWVPREMRHSGGPDSFGYVFLDSHEPDGPEFFYLFPDGETITDMGDDAYSGPIQLPFEFTFYGETYSQVYINSNGSISFGNGSIVYNNTVIPDQGSPNHIIALFWDDLDPSSGGTIEYGTVGSSWVCSFVDVREYGGNGTISAEVILTDDNEIILQYLELNNGIHIGGETIGIENSNGVAGLMASFDNNPGSYPQESLAIRFYQIEPDASVSGIVIDQETQEPISNAEVVFGAILTTTDSNGFYEQSEIWSGTYDVTISKDGYLDFYQEEIEIIEGENVLNAELVFSGFPSGLVGYWTFDNPNNLVGASVGNDLNLVGTHALAEGPEEGDGAVNIGVGSFYRCYHDIEANGYYSNPDWVNIFTIVMDIKIPLAGPWYTMYQTNWPNSNDGDAFVNPEGQVGVSDTGYSLYSLIPGEWYRLVISVNLGVHYDYYLDGQLLHNGGPQGFEGRFSLYPANDANQVLFFADNDGDDNPLDVAMLGLFDRDLSAEEIESMGGYGHEFESPPSTYMTPFLQTPTPNSIYICWHSDGSTESKVEYGLTEELGQISTGSYHTFSESLIWHWVKMENLLPDTDYYYKVISDSSESSIRLFQTHHPYSDTLSHVRFAIYSDSQTYPSVHSSVVGAMKETFEERYGTDYYQEVHLAMLSGDIVDNGYSVGQYTNMFFNPIAQVSDHLPYMTVAGNHEMEAPEFYHYLKYEDFGGTEGEKYFSFFIGPVLFIGLNSNVQGNTQLNWLEDLLETAQNDDAVKFIFASLHHPGQSETWPDGNTWWVQNQVIPLLASHEKVEQLSYGHTHAYERGATMEGNLRIMCFGGGGGYLDRWRMYSNQVDYPEIHRSHDYHGYTVIDVDCENDSYTATAYSLGNSDVQMDNEEFDSWFRDRNASPPETPLGLYPNAGNGDIDGRLVASPYTGEIDIMSSQFQLKEAGDAWSQLIIDSKRDWENVYYDTGPPNYVPIDLNAGIDLQRYQIPEGALQSSQFYEWRIRYRDQNLLWSDWSAPVTFTAMETGNTVDFSADITEGDVPLLVRFTDFSTGDPVLWSWDLDGDQITDSGEQDPEWLYEFSGTYNVSLTVNYQNEELTIIKEAYITAGQFSQVDISFNEGWNMVGLPLEVENPNYQILFPEAVEKTLYNFNMGYNLAEDLEAGIGYWMRLYNSGVTQLEGYVISEIEIELNEGWNLISGISEVTSIANFIDPEEIIIPNTAYTFENGYINTDVFNPGNGYWIRAYQDGTIIIDNSGLAYRESSFDYDISGTCNSLTVNGISLFFGVDIPENMKLSYSLPPKPPSGAFDIRFSGDTRIMMDKAEIEVMGPYESITISYDVVLDAGEHMNWVLSTGIGEEYILEQESEIVVPFADRFILEKRAVVPKTFALHQNYPNPFNPITTLRYDLPVDNHITLTIYDLNGREINQIVNTSKPAGHHSVMWNSTDSFGKPVSAGIYLYQIRTSGFVQTRKMVLLK